MAMALLEPYRFQSVYRDAVERQNLPVLVACTLVTLELRSDEFDGILPAAFKLLPVEQEKPVLAAIFKRGSTMGYPLALAYARCVSDDSAMADASTTFRHPGGLGRSARSCTSRGRSPNSS